MALPRCNAKVDGKKCALSEGHAVKHSAVSGGNVTRKVGSVSNVKKARK